MPDPNDGVHPAVQSQTAGPSILVSLSTSWCMFVESPRGYSINGRWRRRFSLDDYTPEDIRPWGRILLRYNISEVRSANAQRTPPPTQLKLAHPSQTEFVICDQTIEENFLDDKSNGFQLEASLIRSAKALERLCFVLAVTTLYLISQGTQIVREGKRRLADAHWFRGSSYLKIGWNWVKRALSRGEALITRCALSAEPDPEPAMASKKQHQKRTQPRFLIELPNAA